MKELLSLRGLIALFLLVVIGVGIFSAVGKIPFGQPDSEVGSAYLEDGRQETGAANTVTSVVVGYRALDTLGEVAVLFIAATGLSTILATSKKRIDRKLEDASLVLKTGCRVFFPMILLFGAYLFIHGHLTPGGGFQGGAVIGSAFLLTYLGCSGRRVSRTASRSLESLSGFGFVFLGLIGLMVGESYFLSNFLPKGELYSLLSAGIFPLIYILIGLKVGAEFAGVIDSMIEESR